MHLEYFEQFFKILNFCRRVSYSANKIYLDSIRFKQLKTTFTDTPPRTHFISGPNLTIEMTIFGLKMMAKSGKGVISQITDLNPNLPP